MYIILLRKETVRQPMQTVDIIVPCYNEQEVISKFYETTRAITDKIAGWSFRFIFVNDGSRDDTLLLMKGLKATYDNVEYISLSRNFGKEAAMYAGFDNSDSSYVIVMDADLQHPPSLIPDMVAAIEEGYDCCAAYRTTRTGEKRFRSMLSRQFYKVNNKLTNVRMPYGAVDFRMMSRQMADAIMTLPEIQRFSKGIFCYVGFETKWIPYENVERKLGTTKWKLKSLIGYAIDGITAFSTAPLHMVSMMGICISCIAIIYGLYIFIKTLVLGVDLPGYASTIILLLFLCGIIELSLGIIGEYVARIFTESKNRPIYIAKENTLKKIREDL